MPAIRHSTIPDEPTYHFTPETYVLHVLYCTYILLCGYLHKVHTIRGQPGVMYASFLPL